MVDQGRFTIIGLHWTCIAKPKTLKDIIFCSYIISQMWTKKYNWNNQACDSTMPDSFKIHIRLNCFFSGGGACFFKSTANPRAREKSLHTQTTMQMFDLWVEGDCKCGRSLGHAQSRKVTRASLYVSVFLPRCSKESVGPCSGTVNPFFFSGVVELLNKYSTRPKSSERNHGEIS